VTITDSQLARLDLVRMRLMVEAEHYLRGAAATDTSPELRSVLTKLGARCATAANDLCDLYRDIRDQP
jgi:hypothetical protein